MIRVRTPLRVSFFGGGTDYPEYFTTHGGAVLAAAVDRFVEVATTDSGASRNGDARYHAEATALAERCLKIAGVGDRRVTARSDVTTSAGLGSSSSCIVGVLHALAVAEGRAIEPASLARDAIRLERDALQTTVGCQDQVLAAYGGFNVVEFRAADDFGVFPIPISDRRLLELEAHLLAINSGLRRRSGPLAARQVSRLSNNLPALCEMRRAVDRGYDLLTTGGGLRPFGELLDAVWRLKRGLDDRVTTPRIDSIYETGLRHGAWGGKLLGCGGGGYVLFCVPPERRAAVRGALAEFEELPIRLGAPGSTVVEHGTRVSNGVPACVA